jgi:hypothetical protein
VNVGRVAAILAVALSAALASALLVACGNGLPAPRAVHATESPRLAGPARGAEEWLRDLRARPLLWDSVDADDSCPVSEPREIPGVGTVGLGNEPLYTLEFPPSLHLSDAQRTLTGWRVPATWVTEPGYRGLLLVRGVELVSRQPVSFERAGTGTTEELYLSTHEAEAEVGSSGVHRWTSELELLGAGCYGLQVEGTGHFAGYLIVFEAVP